MQFISLYNYFLVSAGAMRIPCPLNDNKRIHFLTDYYAIDYFKLEMVKFINSCENGFLKFYNKPKVQQKGIIIILKHFTHYHTCTVPSATCNISVPLLCIVY